MASTERLLLAARAGGAGAATGAVRVTFWGALAMAMTYAVGRLFGAVVQTGSSRAAGPSRDGVHT